MAGRYYTIHDDGLFHDCTLCISETNNETIVPLAKNLTVLNGEILTPIFQTDPPWPSLLISRNEHQAFLKDQEPRRFALYAYTYKIKSQKAPSVVSAVYVFRVSGQFIHLKRQAKNLEGFLPLKTAQATFFVKTATIKGEERLYAQAVED